MSTWQLFADNGNSFRWEISGQQLQAEPDEGLHDASIQQSSYAHRLPSMADLLRQGCSKLMENCPDTVDSPPMFKTGLGKSVVLNKSSISKALSILGDEGDFVPALGGQLRARANQGSLSNSMFQTGSGKAVNISSTGLVRAKTLLGLVENHKNDTFNGFEHTKNQSNASEPFYNRSSSHLSVPKDTISAPIPPFNFQSGSLGSGLKEVTPNYVDSATRPPPIKFQTAGGRSLSVSSDALQRARSLLGDPELGTFLSETDSSDPTFSICKDTKSINSSLEKENDPSTSLPYQETTKIKQVSKVFISPIKPSSNQKQSSARSNNLLSGSNLIKKFDAESDDNSNRRYDDIPRPLKPLTHRPNSLNGRSSAVPLSDISNTVGINDTNIKQAFGEKRRFGRRSSISPFKRPRISKFITPLNSNTSSVANGGLSTLAPEESYSKRRVSTRYPFQASRTYIKEYFEVPPCHHKKLVHLSDWIRRMNPDNAEKHVFHEGPGPDSVGVKDFSHMLSQAGASMQYVSPKWVANHYKWIVWKLACYERCNPAKFSGKMLTVSNALEELKYRYEREVNHGHRSAIRRILEGDASPSSMLVLCISSIYVKCDLETETLATSDGAEGSAAAKIEVTDGWYSVNALLDVLLSKKLAAGKLFVGQKIRIAGAGLCGWAGPVSPLEASSTVSLTLHINGTYRAHWGDRLGFCKESGTPLAFRCIKGFGGAVPSTLIGVTRIYPILYRERLCDGGFVVRSERLETKMVQLYNQRRSAVAEGIMSEFQMGNKESDTQNDYDSDEGAKILKILETAAEPEVLMAEMSSEQLNSFATYRAKLEAMRLSDVHKSIEKALVDAGLSEREVSPFMRVRVVGLTTKSDTRNCSRKGLITIWNPTAKQQSELVEGKAYVISALVPLGSDSDTLYLQASGGTTKWMPLSSSAIQQFQPFFSPRKLVSLSKMGEVPLSTEFDISAFVLYVGEVYMASHQKKQWVFVTDGSISSLNPEEPSNALLAISFSSSYIDGDSFVPINHNLQGSTVGFCNLIKRAKDQMNHLWVAEATENSDYFLSYDHAHCTHLKDAAASAQRWAKNSSKTIEKLRVKVLSIIGKC